MLSGKSHKCQLIVMLSHWVSCWGLAWLSVRGCPGSDYKTIMAWETWSLGLSLSSPTWLMQCARIVLGRIPSSRYGWMRDACSSLCCWRSRRLETWVLKTFLAAKQRDLCWEVEGCRRIDKVGWRWGLFCQRSVDSRCKCLCGLGSVF